jgi:hypothetical protein
MAEIADDTDGFLGEVARMPAESLLRNTRNPDEVGTRSRR